MYYIQRLGLFLVLLLSVSACSSESADKTTVEKWNSYTAVMNGLGKDFDENIGNIFEIFSQTIDWKAPPKQLRDWICNDLSFTDKSVIFNRALEQTKKSPVQPFDVLMREYVEIVKPLSGDIIELASYIKKKTYANDEGALGKELQAKILDEAKIFLAIKDKFNEESDKRSDETRKMAIKNMAANGQVIRSEMFKVFLQAEKMEKILVSMAERNEEIEDVLTAFSLDTLVPLEEEFKPMLKELKGQITEERAKKEKIYYADCSGFYSEAEAYEKSFLTLIEHLKKKETSQDVYNRDFEHLEKGFDTILELYNRSTRIAK